MRFLHTADWHIGKKLNGFDLLLEQADALDQILALAVKEQVTAVVVAGDLYDRGVPAIDAVQLFNKKIIAFNLQNKLPLLTISGNHDSSERLNFGTPWFSQTAFHLHTELTQAFQPIVIEDTQFFLLPYFEPFQARLYFEDESIKTLAKAMERVIAAMTARFDPQKKHVLVAHFFAAGSSQSDSETKIMVGGLDSVPVDLLAVFDYVALGHLHNHQALKHPFVQYSGAPLKYAVSEEKQTKGVYIVDTQDFSRIFYPLKPLHDVRTLTASYEELLVPEFYQSIPREDFLQIQLTNRGVIPNLMNQLRNIYPRLLGIERLNQVQRENQLEKVKKRADVPAEIVTEFFAEMTSETLTTSQEDWLAKGLQATSKQVEKL
ncbi:exonuclease SbcCD subunit D [Enterococcus sp.]|uniref:exonuclease SbcCD subunit D n=2 Tax=Enterococcus sp. TaxID=35783 RepID=UPI002FCC795E